MMQAQIPQELSALMALSQGMQQGRVAPTTPEGAPTIAAQKMGQVEQVMMPGMQQALGQAGLGGQIKAMQMQEAQKAMMNAAMQQAQPPAGIERLNPQMSGFAEGGIVGYAGAGTAREEMNPLVALLRKIGEVGLPTRGGVTSDREVSQQLPDERERALEVIAATTPMMEIPEVVVQENRPAPPPVERQPSAARPSGGGGGIEDLANKQRAIYASMTGPTTPEDAIAYELKRRPAIDAYLRSQGVDPNYFEKRSEEDKALTEQQRALLRERMEREKGRDTFLGRMGEALRGFSQMRGQGVGPGILRSNEALERRLASGEARMDQMRDLEIRINELEINRRRSLEDAKRATMEGRVKDAEQSLNNANAFNNEIKKLTAATYPTQMQQMVEERKIVEAAAGRAETAAGRSEQEKSRQMLAAQGRLTEAEKARSAVVEKNKTFLALPKDTKDPMTKQLRETAENEVRQADLNVAQARSLYNSILSQTLGTQPSAGVRYAVNQQTGQRIMTTDGGKTWQPAR